MHKTYKMSSNLKCGICMVYTSFREGDYFLTTPCGHVFHYECFRERLYRIPHNGVANCPLCKKKIQLNRAVKLQGISPSDTSVSTKLASLKFIIIGDSGVGKTGLLLQYARGVFPQHHNTTVGCDLYFKNVEISGKVILLSIWDCGGQERFDAITPNYMRNAHGVLLVYDITRPETFDHLNKWIKMTKDNAPPDIHTILIGNKVDLQETREVPTERGKALANQLGINFLETSAKRAHNVDAAFRALTAATLDSLQQAGRIDALQLTQNDKHPNPGDFTCIC